MDYGLKFTPQDYTAALMQIGQNFGNAYQRNRMGNAVAEHPGDINAQVEALLKMGRIDEAAKLGALGVARSRTTGGGRPMSQMDQFKAERMLKQDAQKAASTNSKAETFATNADDVATYADTVAKMPGLDAATGGYKAGTGVPFIDKAAEYIPAESVPNKPGGNAANFEAAKKTLKAKIGFTELQAMRNASQTGGALGQVAVQEIDFLQNSIAALDGIQDPKLMRQSMADIASHYRKLSGLMRQMKQSGEMSGGGESQYQEGQTATNKATGQKMIFRGGAWGPVE